MPYTMHVQNRNRNINESQSMRKWDDRKCIECLVVPKMNLLDQRHLYFSASMHRVHIYVNPFVFCTISSDLFCAHRKIVCDAPSFIHKSNTRIRLDRIYVRTKSFHRRRNNANRHRSSIDKCKILLKPVHILLIRSPVCACVCSIEIIPILHVPMQ